MATGTKQAILDNILDNALDKRDPALTNVGVKARLDLIGDLLNDLKAQWNAVNPGDLITADDYDATKVDET